MTELDQAFEAIQGFVESEPALAPFVDRVKVVREQAHAFAKGKRQLEELFVGERPQIKLPLEIVQRIIEVSGKVPHIEDDDSKDVRRDYGLLLGNYSNAFFFVVWQYPHLMRSAR